MGKTKSRANGDGDVFPRKNKAGKTTSNRGAYVDDDRSGRAGSVRADRAMELRCARSTGCR